MLLWKIFSVERNLHGTCLDSKEKEIKIHEKGVFTRGEEGDRVTYEGTYFNTLSTNLQFNINEFMRKNILMDDVVNVLYYISLNREVYKYINYLRSVMEGFVGNFDPELNKLKLEI